MQISRSLRGSLKIFNDDEFLNDLREINWTDIHSLVNPNDMWSVWLTKFSTLLDIHAPIMKKRLRYNKSPWINSSLISKLRERDSLKKRFDKNPNDVIWSKYKKTRNEANKLIKKTKRDFFLARINSAKSDPKKTWKLINELSSHKVHEPVNVKSIKQDGTEITNPYDIANAFNTYFTTIGDSLANELPHSDINPISYLYPVNSSFSFAQINVETVIETLKAANSNKATGPNNIPVRVLKIAAEILSPSLTAIFNRSLSMGIYPDDWKMARVLPIFKSGEKGDLSNYRPISIISAIAKVFGRLVYDQFYTYLTSNRLINSYQSGFRPTYSTLTSLLESTNNWCVNIDRGLLNGVVFIDLKKAFDTIDHEVLISKLRAYGVDDLTLPWFRSYLADRKQRCFVNGQFSNSSFITKGVPQGSIIGPLLFLVYINDLPNCLNEGIPRMFADDTNISFSSNTLSDLERLINFELQSLSRWLIANKLSLNIAKTEFMVIGSRQRLATFDDHELCVTVNNASVKQVKSAKTLGLTLDENLTCRDHVEVISKKISSGIGALKRIRGLIDQETAIKVYPGFIEPYFSYCAPVWDGLGHTLSDRLQKLQNRAARVITRSSYDISSNLLLDQLKWNNLSVNRLKQKAILMYKTLNGQTPQYLHEMFSSRRCQYPLRNSNGKLFIPKRNTDYLKRSFSYSGAILWNNLPESLRLSSSFTAFKSSLESLYSRRTDSRTATR